LDKQEVMDPFDNNEEETRLLHDLYDEHDEVLDLGQLDK